MEGTRAKKTNGSGKTAKLAKVPKFDVKTFLSSVGSGRTIEKYQRKKIIFQHGDPADGVFYIQSGKVGADRSCRGDYNGGRRQRQRFLVRERRSRGQTGLFGKVTGVPLDANGSS